MIINLAQEADRLEAVAHQLRQWLRPQLDFLKAVEDAAQRLRRAGRPGPVEDPRPPAPPA